MTDPADDNRASTPDEEDAAKPSSDLSPEDLFLRLKTWYLDDYDQRADWATEAKEDFAFYAGDQWTEDDRTALKKQMRPLITFNRTQMVLDSVSGSEVNNRQEVRYLPRVPGPQSTDDEAAEIVTEAGKYFRNEAHAEDEESDAFMDACICGIGVTETRLEFNEDPDGAYVKERIDPLEMVWDGSARRSNLLDARRVFRVKDMSLAEAKEMFPDADIKALDAAWARGEEMTKTKHVNAPRYRNDEVKNDAHRERVTIVHAVWKEVEQGRRITLGPGNSVDLSEEDYRKGKAMIPPGAQVKEINVIVWKQAFLGSELLGEADYTQCKKPMWYFITGKRDRNKETWFGIVRSMKDPQRWANKWLSQSLHILNSQAKGGIIAEQTAFADIKQARESYAKADVITLAAPGAITSGKIMPKPAAQMPAGFMQLMEFAVSSVRDVSGINLEMLGMADREQPGIVEASRKQSAMTILARMFDSLRRYRKSEGELMLNLITEYMSDGRLVRIVGDEGAKYVPLIRQPGLIKYDIIVDQSPSSANEKERTWEIVEAMMPVVAPMMNAQMWCDILPFSPLPASVVEKLTQTIQQAGQQPPPPDPEMIKAQTAAQTMQMKAQLDQQNAQTQAQLEAQKAQMQAGLQQQSAEHSAQIEYAKMQKQAEVERAQAQADLEVQRQKSALEYEMALRKHELDTQKLQMQMTHEQQKHEMALHLKSQDQQATATQAKGQNDNSAQLAEALKALADAHSRPKKARKGPDGSWMVELG